EADPPEPSRFVREFTGRILAVTEGEGGARVYAEGQGYHFPAYPTGTVDPTGAGDVFAASFLVALRQGRGIVEAAAFACCAASFVVERPGVEGVPPHGAAVEERLAAYRRRFQPKGIPR
ncbi:MAG: carbohydrate kinase family protein, partial [Acidobacteriota bacterium]